MELTDRSQKITHRHLRRQAYLYIRQSTLRQVVENTESTDRQYALRQRAVALGWPIEQVVVIDRDQPIRCPRTCWRKSGSSVNADGACPRPVYHERPPSNVCCHAIG